MKERGHCRVVNLRGQERVLWESEGDQVSQPLMWGRLCRAEDMCPTLRNGWEMGGVLSHRSLEVGTGQQEKFSQLQAALCEGRAVFG